MKDHLLTLEKIFLRATIIGFGIMLFSFVMILIMGDFAFKIHSSMFPMTKAQYSLFMYGFIGFLKLQVFIFFLIPYISIMMVRKKMES